MTPADELRARAEHMREAAVFARRKAQRLEAGAEECEAEAKRMEEAASSRQRW